MLDFSEILIEFAKTYGLELENFKANLLRDPKPKIAFENNNGSVQELAYEDIYQTGAYRKDLKTWFEAKHVKSAIVIYHGVHSATYGKSHIVRVVPENRIPTMAAQSMSEANSILVRILHRDLGEHMLVIPFTRQNGAVEYNNIQVIKVETRTRRAA